MYEFLKKPGLTFSDNKSVDLNKLSVIELKDILERQDKLLNNGKFIQSLPDKGQKIKDYRQKVVEKLKSKELVEETTSILARLNLSQKVDLQHPMASSSGIVLKPEVDPYAKVLCQALEEAQPKTKFVPNKSKDELKKETSSSSTPESRKLKSEKDSRSINIPTPPPTLKRSEAVNKDTNISSPESNKEYKSKAEKIVEKYKDTGLVYGPSETSLKELSVDESLALSKSQIEKEKQVNIIRRVERTIKFYEEAEEEEEDSTGEQSDDEKGTTVVFQYMK